MGFYEVLIKQDLGLGLSRLGGRYEALEVLGERHEVGSILAKIPHFPQGDRLFGLGGHSEKIDCGEPILGAAGSVRKKKFASAGGGWNVAGSGGSDDPIDNGLVGWGRKAPVLVQNRKLEHAFGVSVFKVLKKRLGVDELYAGLVLDRV